MSRAEDLPIHMTNIRSKSSPPSTSQVYDYGASPRRFSADAMGGTTQTLEDPDHSFNVPHYPITPRNDTGGGRSREVAFAKPPLTIRTNQPQRRTTVPLADHSPGPTRSPWQPLVSSPSVTSFGGSDHDVNSVRGNSSQPSLIPSSASNIQLSQRHKTPSLLPIQHGSRKDRTATADSQAYAAEVATSASEAWRTCSKRLREHDKHMVKGWKEDIDTLLVFAGLFSAVVTAFNVEAYKLLQQDPQETAVLLLGKIAGQLGSNVTSILTDPDQEVDPHSAFSRRLNTLWFASLVFSLAAASMGILVKQWLRAYVSDSASSPRESARIRQFRLDGLLKWKVPEIIALLPVMLQTALAFFFIGLVDLLWSLDPIVASIITVFVTASLLFLIITTILPSFNAGCPHRSPQALSVYRTRQWFIRGLSWLIPKIARLIPSWSQRPWPIYVEPTMLQSTHRKIHRWITTLMDGRHRRTWREREKHHITTCEGSLDYRILAGADATFMDDKFLHNVLRVCINDTECPAALDSLCDILNNRAHGFLGGVPRWKHSDAVDSGLSTLAHLVTDILTRINVEDETSVLRMLNMLDRLCRAFPFEIDHPESVFLYEQVHNSLARLMYGRDGVREAAFLSMRELFTRSHVPVNDVVIESIICYTRHARAKNRVRDFDMACTMALCFAKLVLKELPHVRGPLGGMLDDIEHYIMTREFTSSDAVPTPSLLMAVLDIAEMDPPPGQLQPHTDVEKSHHRYEIS
ncbi:unnamed protein product [Somion occarium]|uniref:DUF6535 domain-containing protein n=2 Tax=Somion occarium TaxID=3059160 RepID=A0ABP1E4F3_9APHY